MPPTFDFTMLALVILALLQVGDYDSTARIIDRGGRELNPFMAKAFEKFGMRRTLIVKGIAVVALGYFIGTQSVELLALLCAFYAVVVTRNYRVFKK